MLSQVRNWRMRSQPGPQGHRQHPKISMLQRFKQLQQFCKLFFASIKACLEFCSDTSCSVACFYHTWVIKMQQCNVLLIILACVGKFLHTLQGLPCNVTSKLDTSKTYQVAASLQGAGQISAWYYGWLMELHTLHDIYWYPDCRVKSSSLAREPPCLQLYRQPKVFTIMLPDQGVCNNIANR